MIKFAFVLIVSLIFFNAVSIIPKEKNGFVVVEAESFYKQELDSIRKWHVVKVGDSEPNNAIAPLASGKSYVEILPDTRKSHGDALIYGENFSAVPGKMAVISYRVKFKTPGRYYVWTSAFSMNSEDNGVHVGINGQWPESGQRIQFCEGKNQWTWSNAQRTDANHCGEPHMIFLDVKKGVHTIQFSMREDGFRMDRFILTKNRDYIPE